MDHAGKAGSEPHMGRDQALVDVAKVVVTAGLTLGSVMLTAFGFIERAVGIERLATDRRFALVALLPGAAALSFLASARALGAAFDASVPPRPVSGVPMQDGVRQEWRC